MVSGLWEYHVLILLFFWWSFLLVVSTQACTDHYSDENWKSSADIQSSPSVQLLPISLPVNFSYLGFPELPASFELMESVVIFLSIPPPCTIAWNLQAVGWDNHGVHFIFLCFLGAISLLAWLPMYLKLLFHIFYFFSPFF